MTTASFYTLRHFRRTTPAVLEDMAWHHFRAESDEQAISEALSRIGGNFDERTDYVPLWRSGAQLIWEGGKRA
jgi:hypothetical protein